MPDIDDLYAVLRTWTGARGKPGTYTELSQQYQARTGDWFEPHGTWDRPLGELNQRLAAVGAPALSALVVLQETQRPGGGFWGCASNVPSPRNESEREKEWVRIVREVLHYSWPAALP